MNPLPFTFVIMAMSLIHISLILIPPFLFFLTLSCSVWLSTDSFNVRLRMEFLKVWSFYSLLLLNFLFFSTYWCGDFCWAHVLSRAPNVVLSHCHWYVASLTCHISMMQHVMLLMLCAKLLCTVVRPSLSSLLSFPQNLECPITM